MTEEKGPCVITMDRRRYILMVLNLAAILLYPQMAGAVIADSAGLSQPAFAGGHYAELAAAVEATLLVPVGAVGHAERGYGHVVNDSGNDPWTTDLPSQFCGPASCTMTVAGVPRVSDGADRSFTAPAARLFADFLPPPTRHPPKRPVQDDATWSGGR